MSTIDWLVLAGGLTAVAWVNWYFFLADRGGAVAIAAPGRGVDGTTDAAGAQEATVIVQGGYAPAVVHARAGRPLRLVFDRREAAGCSEEVVLGDFGIRRFLPAHERTVVELPPAAPGSYEFTCGMGMLRGRIVVE